MSDFDFFDEEEEGFDLAAEADKADDGDFTPLPTKPWYNCKVIAAELKESKNGKGKYVEVRLDIEGPSHAGRVVFDRIIVVHESKKAVEIGRPRFASLCQAAGFEKRPDDAKELIGNIVGVKMKTEKDKEYGDRSVPRAYALPKDASDFNDDDIPF